MSIRINKTVSKNNIGNIDALVLIAFCAYGLVSQYFILCLLAGATFVLILRKLWKPYFPPVFLFFMALHWLQVFGSVLYADSEGKSMDELFSSSGTEYLFTITFFQLMLVVMFLSTFMSKRVNINTPSLEKLHSEASKLNERNVIIGYFISALAIPSLQSFAYSSASLFQLISSFGIIKYIFTGLLVFLLFLNVTKYRLLIIGILVFDFVMSFASFFSDFKTILIMVIVIYFTVTPYLKRKTIYRMLPVMAVLVVFMAFWSYVKTDYRVFLNTGSRQQVQNVTDAQALGFLVEKSGNVGLRELREGVSILFSRMQYMQRYAEVYKRVPSVVPHAGGADFSQTVQFVMIPRFLNKNKGIKDASEKTSYYTGNRFSNSSQGTSISMGYYCELFIDYGLYFMVFPILMFMAVIGYVYVTVLKFKQYNLLFVYSLLIGFFLTLGTFESDMVFFLGVLRNNIAFLVVGHIAFFSLLNKWVLKK